MIQKGARQGIHVDCASAEKPGRRPLRRPFGPLRRVVVAMDDVPRSSDLDAEPRNSLRCVVFAGER